MLLFKKFQISYLAWKLESDLCGSKLHQYSTLTTKAASFNGFREYILKLDCQNQGKEIQMICNIFIIRLIRITMYIIGFKICIIII